MKAIALSIAVLLAVGPWAVADTNHLTGLLQRALLEEEANRNLEAAIQAYEALLKQFDRDRALAATAVYRLGECYRKQGNTNAAVGQYQRLLRDFSEQEPLATLSRQNLAALGAIAAGADPRLAGGSGLGSDAGGVSGADALLNRLQQLEDTVQVRIALQQAYPNNTVFAGLLHRLATAEREMAALQLEYGPNHPRVEKQAALIQTLNHQIDEQVKGIMDQLEAAARRPGREEVESAEVARIRTLIRDSPDLVNAPQRNGMTLLDAAAARGEVAVVRLLLENGAAASGLRQPSLTPLHYAAGNGHKAVVDLLLARGGKVDAATESGVMPLHLAALKGFTEVAQSLVQAQAPVRARITSTVSRTEEELNYSVEAGQNPLHLAARAGFARMAELLLAAGADVNAVDGAGQTALSIAASAKASATVDVLLNAEADPNAGMAELPLVAAVRADATDVLERLLGAGADPNRVAPGLRGPFARQPVSPLGLAVSEGRLAAAERLIAAGALLDARAPNGALLLNAALERNDLPLLEVLLKAGADPNRAGEGQLVPLLEAIRTRKAAAVDALLQYHADPAVRTKEGLSALHFAVTMREAEIVERLIQAGADVSTRDAAGQTPLHYAASNGEDTLVALLLKAQADPNALNEAGQTPLDLALGRRTGPMGGPQPGLAVALPSVPVRPGQVQAALPPVAMRPGQAQGGAPSRVAALLRERGALDEVPRLDRIQMRRSANGYGATLLARDKAGVNQFTLLEALGMHYGLIARTSADARARRYSHEMSDDPLKFPDFARIRVRQPGPDLKGWQEQVVDLAAHLEAGECPAPLRLPWGAVVDVPELDRPINEAWRGLSRSQLLTFKKCLARVVLLSVKGVETELTLEPDIQQQGEPLIYTGASFWLKRVLQTSKQVLASSDLARVKVIRPGLAGEAAREWVLDCTPTSQDSDFWLEHGDRVEIPERR